MEDTTHDFDSLFPVSGGFLGLLLCARYAAVPVVYMAIPPTMPPWKDLLELNEDGVRRPRRRKMEDGNNKIDFPVVWWDLVEFTLIYLLDWYQ